MKGALSGPKESRANDNYGCLQHRLGSGMSGEENRRTLVRGRKSPTHKRLGAASSNASSEMLHKREAGNPDPIEDGQYDGADLYQ